jgi:photosystem II stability/assembly factor-like uncharacterized protein
VSGSALAQAPPYYNFDSTGGANSFPFNVGAGKQVQWLLAPGELNRPSPVPGGQSITKIYFRANSAASPTFTDLTIKLGQATITSLPIGVVYTGPLTTVFYRASIPITSTAQQWLSFTLDTPFLYDPTQSLIIDVQQCGMAGTGFTINQRIYGTTSTPRRTYLTSAPCPQSYSGQDGNLCAFGVEVVPAGTPGWSAQTSGISTALMSVSAVSPLVGWAAGAGGVVLRTTDGGNNWTSVGGGSIGANAINAIKAVSASTAFVTTAPSTSLSHIFRTTNGGTSWDTVYTQDAAGLNPFINAIHMFDANNGIAQGDPVGGKWTIVRTTNGGTSWTRDTANAPTQVGSEYGANNGMKVLGTTHIWFTPGTGNGFYRSTDGGTTWTRSTLPASGFTAGVNFLDTQVGVVGNSGGVAARTTDGGATWTPVTIGTSGAIYSVGAAGTIEFWATRGTTVQTSKNRGVNWAQDFSDATAGTFNHSDFVVSGGTVKGWGVTSTGKIYTYFNPVALHDLGVTSLSKLVLTADRQTSGSTVSKATPTPARASVEPDLAATPLNAIAGEIPEPKTGVLIEPLARTSFTLADTVRFRAIVRNSGTFPETTYQVGWSINGANQTPLNNTRILAPGALDTFQLQWNQGVNGTHVARAWTILATDGNRANDTATVNFNVGLVPGDTLYTFVVPNEIILGVSKMGPSSKIVFTSGGQSSGVTTDNKWIVTDMVGNILDASHPQLNPTSTGASPGFGFRDLSWDGRWLLTSDDNRIRRVDTLTFSEIATPITFGSPTTSLHRGLGFERVNKIWKSNFTSEPVIAVDTAGTTLRTLGTPTVAPYGIAFDKWTSRNRGYLWYSEPSTTGQPARLSKVDTASGTILQTFDYGTLFGISGGLDIFVGHPAFPGRVVATLVTQNYPNSRCLIINLGPDSSTVNVNETEPLPQDFSLLQNYPNPFNPTTTIRYALPEAARVNLSIYNMLGQRVATLTEEAQNAGYHEAIWDGRNEAGVPVASGVYFYRMDATPSSGGAPFIHLKKMVLLK